MRYLIAILIAGVALTTMGTTASAERLELGLAFTPTVLQDESYEAFSNENLSILRMGADIRVEVADLKGFRFMPFVGYRFGTDSGEPFYVLNTELNTHDFAAGLRVHRELLPWLGVFAEASGGLLVAGMTGSPVYQHSLYYGELNTRQDYKDRQITWIAQGLAGVELHLPKDWLKSRGVNWFGFGIEVAGGYAGRGDLEFKPSLEQGGDNAIDAKTLPWGTVNLSGWMVQVGASFKFF